MSIDQFFFASLDPPLVPLLHTTPASSPFPHLHPANPSTEHHTLQNIMSGPPQRPSLQDVERLRKEREEALAERDQLAKLLEKVR